MSAQNKFSEPSSKDNGTSLSELLLVALRVVFSRLSGYQLPAIIFAGCLMLAIAYIAVIQPLILGDIVNRATQGTVHSLGDISDDITLIAGLILFEVLLTIVRKYSLEKVATQIEGEEYFKVTSHVLSLDLNELADERIGAFNLRLNRSIEGLVKFLKLTFMDFLPTLVIAVFALGTAILTSPIVAGVMVAVGLAGLALTAVQIESQRGIRTFLFAAKADLSANITEVLLGIDYVRAAGTIEQEVEKTKRLAENFRDQEFTHHKWMMSFDSAKQLVEGVGFISVIALSTWLASGSDYGAVLTLTVLYSKFVNPLRDLNRILDEGIEACQKVEELDQLYQKKSEPGLSGKEVVKLPLEKQQPVVSCRGITVQYRNGFTPLRDVEFEIRRGERVGIAGPSGSGKSTLVKLVLGLISNYDGSIKLFGEEARTLNKTQLAELVSYVPQTPFLIKGTIRDNVVYAAKHTPTDGEIESALSRARLLAKIESLKVSDPLDAEVLEQGRNFSGGEKQRLALARVFLSKAQLLVLDEPTAALDTENQALVQGAIFELTRDRTALIVAHRLNTLQQADRIIVLDKGCVVQMGSYTELEQVPGLFRSLIEKERIETKPTKSEQALA